MMNSMKQSLMMIDPKSAEAKDLMHLIAPGETLLYLARGTKINPKGATESRLFVFTDKSLCILRDDKNMGIFGRVFNSFKGGEVRRSIPLTDITAITVSMRAKSFVIHCEKQRDILVLMELGQLEETIKKLFKAKMGGQKDNSTTLKVYFVDDADLEKYTTKADTDKKNHPTNLKDPQTDFKYHEFKNHFASLSKAASTIDFSNYTVLNLVPEHAFGSKAYFVENNKDRSLAILKEVVTRDKRFDINGSGKTELEFFKYVHCPLVVHPIGLHEKVGHFFLLENLKEIKTLDDLCAKPLDEGRARVYCAEILTLLLEIHTKGYHLKVERGEDLFRYLLLDNKGHILLGNFSVLGKTPMQVEGEGESAENVHVNKDWLHFAQILNRLSFAEELRQQILDAVHAKLDNIDEMIMNHDCFKLIEWSEIYLKTTPIPEPHAPIQVPEGYNLKRIEDSTLM